MKAYLKVIYTGVLIGVILFALALIFTVITGGKINLDAGLLKNLGVSILYSVPLTIVNGRFFTYMNTNVSWKRFKNFRFVISFSGSIIITLLTVFAIRTFHEVILTQKTFEEFITNENPQSYFIALLITIVISLFFHTLYFYKAIQENRVKEQKVIAGAASAKFESLKNQIDPHFLFNSLNVLTSLIEENPVNAQKFTTSLSKIYRYVLEQKDKELVSVEEELAFARTYMDLLNMRFENSVFYEVPERLTNPEAKVVPLSLQLLLENAVKHNSISENKPLRIRIYEEENYLVVENNFQKKEVLQKGQGVGLQNIISRYNIVTNRKVKIEENAKIFRVKLPVLTQKITVMETNYMDKDNAYFKAKAHVKEIKEFYGNLLSYCLVIPFLIFINYYTFWEFEWFWFPLLGWGLGLTVHGFSVFGYGANWEERKIKELMQKEHQQNKSWK